MTRLPVPGGDHNAWGDILNDFLSVEHNQDGTLKVSAAIAEIADKYVKPAGGIPLSDLHSSVAGAITGAGNTRTCVTLGLTSGDYAVSAYANFRMALLAALAAAQSAGA